MRNDEELEYRRRSVNQERDSQQSEHQRRCSLDSRQVDPLLLSLGVVSVAGGGSGGTALTQAEPSALTAAIVQPKHSGPAPPTSKVESRKASCEIISRAELSSAAYPTPAVSTRVRVTLVCDLG